MNNQCTAKRYYANDLPAGSVVTCNVSLRVYKDYTPESKVFIIPPGTIIVIMYEETENDQPLKRKIFRILTENQFGILYMPIDKLCASFDIISHLC